MQPKNKKQLFFFHHWLESCYELDLILNMVLQYIFFGAFFLINIAKMIFVNFYLFLKNHFHWPGCLLKNKVSIMEHSRWIFFSQNIENLVSPSSSNNRLFLAHTRQLNAVKPFLFGGHWFGISHHLYREWVKTFF